MNVNVAVGIRDCPIHRGPTGVRFRSIIRFRGRKQEMIWTIFVILIILWLTGLLGHIGGNLIHIVLVVAVIVLIFNLLTGRRAGD